MLGYCLLIIDELSLTPPFIINVHKFNAKKKYKDHENSCLNFEVQYKFEDFNDDYYALLHNNFYQVS